jgi:hypothetical protein
MNLKCLTTFSIFSLIEDTYHGLHIMMHFNFTLYIIPLLCNGLHLFYLFFFVLAEQKTILLLLIFDRVFVILSYCTRTIVSVNLSTLVR